MRINQSAKSHVKRRPNLRLMLCLLLCLLLFLCLIHIVNQLLSGQLMAYGIAPRYLPSLPYIFTAPFIHGDLPHLINNLVALGLLSLLTLHQSVAYFLRASAVIIVVSGLLVWLLARNAIHVGASGWIYGLWALVIARAWYVRSFTDIVMGLAVIFLYGGMIYGLLPNRPGVSFESHIFGALTGVLVAVWDSKMAHAKWARKGWGKR